MSSPYSPTSNGWEYDFNNPWRVPKRTGINGPRSPSNSPPDRLMNPSPPPRQTFESSSKGATTSGITKGRRSPILHNRISKSKELPLCRKTGRGPRTPPYPENSKFGRANLWSPRIKNPRETHTLSPRISNTRRSSPMSPGNRKLREPLSLHSGIRKPREPPPPSPRTIKIRRSPPLSPPNTIMRRTPPETYRNIRSPPVSTGFPEPLMIPLVLPPRPNRQRNLSPEEQPPNKTKIRSPPPPLSKRNKSPSPCSLSSRLTKPLPSQPPPPPTPKPMNTPKQMNTPKPMNTHKPMNTPLSSSLLNKPQHSPIKNSQSAPMFYAIFGSTPNENIHCTQVEERKQEKNKNKKIINNSNGYSKENKNDPRITHEGAINSEENSTGTRKRFFASEAEKQRTVEKVVKQALKPHLFTAEINKNDYTEILKRAVMKISRATTDRISLNKEKIGKFVEAYVQTFKLRNIYKELEDKIKVPQSPTKNGNKHIARNGNGVTLNFMNSYLPV